MSTRNKVWPEVPDSTQERNREVLHDALCRHLVCLGVRFEYLSEQEGAKARERRDLYSCFVVEVKGKWFLVTAGHILKSLEEAVAAKRIRIVRSFYADFFGHRGVLEKLTPFPFESIPKFFIDDRDLGLDFAFMPLSHIFQEGLKKSGIIPFTEANWKNWHPLCFSSYWMLGFPSEVDGRKDSRDDRDVLDTKLSSVIVSLDAVKYRSLIPSSIPITESKFPWFIGKINVDIPFNIQGMSGGPVFGLTDAASDSLAYTAVAMQSHWYPDSRIIMGCPLTVFGQLMSKNADKLINSSVE